jgi:hypothetical protein
LVGTVIVLIEIPVVANISAEVRPTTGDLRVMISARVEISVFGAMVVIIELM